MTKNIVNKLFRKLKFKVERYNLNNSQVAWMARLLEYQHIDFSIWVLTVEDYCKLIKYS
ncbi:hypothetical protein MSj_04066 [Microcystis aeruginosa Sj]|uniref:Uncharacterized protein n=1 Tax=Microcystis aeruginosa Sj TaxID=1979544 RepID=A0A2Z6UXD9_MICAE|nr:hypothetical protein MSj_04066 [Microcystis aeruginosa Sj]